MDGDTVELRYLPHGQPMPEGWELAEDLGQPLTRHHHYSVLIKRRTATPAHSAPTAAHTAHTTAQQGRPWDDTQ